MYFKPPKNDKYVIWTRHAVQKMRQYGLSEGCLRRLLNNYHRREEGIAPGTTAIMQPTRSKKHPTEIWLMYQLLKTSGHTARMGGNKIKIITAWRYPGISPKRGVPIPEDIKEEMCKYKE